MNRLSTGTRDYPLPEDEQERLEVLHEYDILDTPPDDKFDQLTELASDLFSVPMALIPILSEKRQWYKSCVGVEHRETPREQAICNYTITRDEPVFEVSHTLEDPRFEDLPGVRGEPGFRSYLGTALTTSEGQPLGSFCILDTVPRDFSERTKERLRILADQAGALLEFHRTSNELRELSQFLDEKVREKTRVIRRREETVVHRLVSALGHRSNETGEHVRRIARAATMMAEQLGWSTKRVQNLELAAAMHDIGKIGIPDRILEKPGDLTEEEFITMQKHTTIGGEIFEDAGFELLETARVVALYHHEWWDGSGYPRGLSGEEIPREAQVVSVVDVYDALRHDRVYRPALGEEEALSIIEHNRGTQFDPDIHDCFRDLHPDLQELQANDRSGGD